MDSLIQTVRVFLMMLVWYLVWANVRCWSWRGKRWFEQRGLNYQMESVSERCTLTDTSMWVLPLDSVMNREMKEKLRSQSNGGNVMAGVNSWTVGIIRYRDGVLDWTKEELKSIDTKTRKLMTVNGSLYLRGNVDRLYLARKEGVRGLTSCEKCVNVEVQGLDKYLSERSC